MSSQAAETQHLGHSKTRPFPVIYRENLKFYIRTRRFQVILPVFAALSALEPILIIVGVVQKPVDVYSFTQGALSQFTEYVLLISALLAGDAISRDFSREGYFTLTQPVRRSEIMFARFLSAFSAALIVVGVIVGIGVASSEYLYLDVVPNTLEILFMGVLLTASLTAFVMMFSSFSKSAAVSIVISVVTLIIAMPIIQDVAQFLTKVEPWFLITYGADAISNLAEKTYPPHLTTLRLGSRTLYVYSPGALEGAIIMAAYLILSIIITWAVYSRRELK
jgi:ABC-type transport system involved in multi-copper enzyme maturation permease subunit